MEGPAEKQGKHFWAPRYLVLSGSRLLVFRYSLTQKKGDENLPLNVIDLTNALVTPATPLVISLQTHREVLSSFPSNLVHLPLPQRRRRHRLGSGAQSRH